MLEIGNFLGNACQKLSQCSDFSIPNLDLGNYAEQLCQILQIRLSIISAVQKIKRVFIQI